MPSLVRDQAVEEAGDTRMHKSMTPRKKRRKKEKRISKFGAKIINILAPNRPQNQ